LKRKIIPIGFHSPAAWSRTPITAHHAYVAHVGAPLEASAKAALVA